METGFDGIAEGSCIAIICYISSSGIIGILGSPVNDFVFNLGKDSFLWDLILLLFLLFFLKKSIKLLLGWMIVNFFLSFFSEEINGSSPASS